MILLWGLSGDGPLDAVRQELHSRGATHVFLDQRDVLDAELMTDAGPPFFGVVRSRGQTVELAQVSGVYLRVYDTREVPCVARAGPGSDARAHALALEGALHAWVELTDARVINRPSAMASNNSKPYQSALIRRHGFEVPATLVTTDPEAVKEFAALHGTLIYKSLSSVRSVVSRLAPAHLERLPDVAWCPTQFQQYVPGKDYRIHVVGDEVFPCEVVSEADDYRYASRQGLRVKLTQCALPREVSERAKTLAAALGLHVAGVDLRRTPGGDWYCFEVNPSPGFTYYEPDDEHPIAAALARLLTTRRDGKTTNPSSGTTSAGCFMPADWKNSRRPCGCDGQSLPSDATT